LVAHGTDGAFRTCNFVILSSQFFPEEVMYPIKLGILSKLLVHDLTFSLKNASTPSQLVLIHSKLIS
jgi:hypothetical protein